MIQVNLLPDVKKEFLHAQRLRNFVISVCIIAAIISGGVLVLLGGIMGAQAIQKSVLNGNIERDFEAIQTYKDDDHLDEYLTVQNQLSQIDPLKEESPIYSRMFDFLRQVNPDGANNIRLSTLQLGENGSVTLTGATATFETLDNFRNVLSMSRFSYSEGEEGDVEIVALFKSVAVTQSSLTQTNNVDEVTFTMIVAFNPIAFDTQTVIHPPIIAPGAVNSGQPVFKESEQ